MINKCVIANNNAFNANQKLYDFCEKEYGFIPPDRDIDAIIDSVFCTNGISNGMSAHMNEEMMNE